jgi:hypothetical protein
VSQENLEGAATLWGFDIWAEFRVEVEELLDAGDAETSNSTSGSIPSISPRSYRFRSVGVGHGSGGEVEERIAHVAWMRDGTPYRVKVFADRKRALEAAGLRE